MFNCTLVPHFPNATVGNYSLPHPKHLSCTVAEALSSWNEGHLIHVACLTDRHDRPVETVHPNQATAWQQAVTEAAEHFSLTKLFCTQDTALQTPCMASEFCIVQTIHMAKEDWSQRLRFKTSRLFFNGITARLNSCFVFLLQTAAKTSEQERTIFSEEVIKEVQQMGTSCALLGNAMALQAAGVGGDLPVKRDTEDRHWYNFGKVDVKGISCSVICLGNWARGTLESDHDSLTAGGDPDKTIFILPTAVGHFSTSGVVYASSVLNPDACVVHSEDCVSWYLCGKEAIGGDSLWLTATQRFIMEIAASPKIKALTITE